MYDVIVIGAGPAGLQAALTLGRMHRSTLVLDSGEYRNEPAQAMHNFITHDGTPPAELRAAARSELTAYDDVELREAVVAHCPFCHGHEFAGGRVAIQGSAHAARLAAMVAPIAGEVLVVTDGFDLSPEDQAVLTRIGGTWISAKVIELSRSGDGVAVSLSDGSTVTADGFFVRSEFVPSSPFAADLELDVLASGCVEIDAFGRTSRPGVYAAGDGAHTAGSPGPMAAVLVAAASGLLAAAACVQDGVADLVTSSTSR